MVTGLEDLKHYLEKNNISFYIKGKDLTRIILLDEEGNEKDKYLFCVGLGGNIFRSNNSIWINKKEKKFLEKNEEWKILFNVSVRWYWSFVKKIEEGKEDGYQCLIDFNELKFLKKSVTKENFVHLHNHFEYSLLDGILTSKKWLEECSMKGFDNIALTDHGTLAGILDFYIESKKVGIKPILGYEAYITDENKLSERGYDHLTLLAKSDIGWRTLLKLNTFAQTKGFYYKPRLTYEFLKEKNKGIIILTGCPFGRIYKLLVGDEFEKATKLYRFYCECVGEDNIYLELQIHNFEDEAKEQQDKFHINLIKLEKMLKKKGLDPKIVLTNDCHYPKKEDFDVWMAVNKISNDKDEREKKFVDDLFLKTRKELYKDFCNSVLKKIVASNAFSDWCENTVKIAKKCNVEIPIGNHNLPSFPLKGTGFKTKEDLFEDIIKKGFKEKITNKIFGKTLSLKGQAEKYKIYQERMEYEKKVIIDCGFIDYFLIIWDLVKAAKENGIYVGLARGSVAGSLVALVMDITAVDPIKFGLIFERFLNETRMISAELFEIEFEDGKKVQLEGSIGVIYEDGKRGEAKDLEKGDDISVF